MPSDFQHQRVASRNLRQPIARRCESRTVDTRLKQANSSHAHIDITVQIFNGFTSFISKKWFVHVFVCFVWLFVAILCLYISCVSVFVCLSDGLCVFAWSGLIRFDLVLV